MEAQCDPVTGLCALPPKTDQSEKVTPPATISTLEILQKIKLTTLNDDEGKPVDIAALPPKPLTLFYCSASWCPPCRSFTPKLSEFLTSKDRPLHCILVSADRTAEDYLEYLTEHCKGMYAIPYQPKSACQELMSTLGVNGIPALIVIETATGKVVTKSGRGAVASNPDGCVEQWLQGRSGTSWFSGVNWASILLYLGLFLLWRWYSSSKA